ncbi:acyltransferase family protein [Candidatus Woesearchaeota archaeon]|nr:acyltransferase family protein [Candidatus Woesearchaeota archaeon]
MARLVFVDNLRLFLIILVILLHVSIIYGGVGNYPIKETPTDKTSQLILTLFNAIYQSFFMSLFFLLSGYFVPRSFDKKGAIRFFSDRLIRLGIPLLIYTTIFKVVLDYLFSIFGKNPVSFIQVLLNDIKHPEWVVGPLWFVEALLIFTFVYVIYRVFINRPFKIRSPANKTIAAAIIMMAVLTFLVRIFFPVGVEIHVFQLGHFVHYTFCFWLGVMAYRGKWLKRFDAGVWKKVAIITVIALPMLVFITTKPELFMGGLNWQSFLFSAWESVACYSIIISLISIFRKNFNKQGKLIKWMAPNFYAVYIIHQLVIVPLAIIFLSIAIPSYVKFLIVSFIGILLCFIISSLIRKIPFAKKIIG